MNVELIKRGNSNNTRNRWRNKTFLMAIKHFCFIYARYGEMAQKVIEWPQWQMTAYAFEIEMAPNSNHLFFLFFYSNYIGERYWWKMYVSEICRWKLLPTCSFYSYIYANFMLVKTIKTVSLMYNLYNKVKCTISLKFAIMTESIRS